MIGEAPVPTWLATEGLLAQFGKRRSEARRRYSQFVREGVGKESIWAGLKQQIYLGDEKFVKRMQKKAKVQGDELTIPRRQRRPPAATLTAIAAKHPELDDAVVAAYGTGSYCYRQIAEHFGVHLATVGRIVRSRLLQGEK